MKEMVHAARPEPSSQASEDYLVDNETLLKRGFLVLLNVKH